MTALVTPRRQHGGAAHTVENPATGHKLRLVRRLPDDVDREVHLVTEHGLVLLGTVTRIGTGSTAGHYALPPVGVAGGWSAESYKGGALALDVHLDATPVTTYLVTPRPEHHAVALLVGAVPAETVED